MFKLKNAVILLLCFFVFGCEQKQKNEDLGIPKEVYDSICSQAQKNFASNKSHAQAYINKQIESYKEFSAYMPSLPAEEYAKIIKYAKDMVGEDYTELYAEVVEMSRMAVDVKEQLDKLSAEDTKFIKSFFNDSNAVEYKSSLNRAKEWFVVLEDMNFVSRHFEKEEFLAIKKRFLENERNTPNDVMPKFYAQTRAVGKVKAFTLRDVPRAKMEEVRALMQQQYPFDYVAQLDAMQKFDFSKYKEDSNKKQNVSPLEKSMRVKAEQIFRDCVFTKRGEADNIDVAVLVKMNGKTVVLCSKNYIPQKMPVVFGNSLGHISCSKAFVSDDYPMVIMIPDEEPKMFEPIEIISPQECRDLHKKSLYLIAPDKGGFTGKPVRVFSEDLKYLNFSVDDTPKTKRMQNIRKLDRDAEKIVIDIIDSFDIGENAIVFDAESRKLVSIALRYYAYGMIDIGGKTGNIIGHEKSEIPDFVSFVRQFDGVVGSTPYPPLSSVRFIRMTDMKNWKRLDVPSFWKQKNAIRKYTDVNNEYLKFFIRGSYGEALRSFRLSGIARKYKNDFESRHISRSSFERRYEAFVIEVLHSMRIDMNKLDGMYISPDKIYSIYRGEFAYQKALRQSMYDYMKEYIKDGNVTAFIDQGINVNGNDSGATINNVNKGGIKRGTNIKYK